MREEYNIFFVYILQAHSNDWKVGNFSHIDQPKTLVARQTLAQKFVEDFKLTMPIYIDDMDNSFNTAFGCWPHKSYVIEHTAESGTCCFSARSQFKLTYVEKIKAIDYKSVTTKLIEFLSTNL
jgi:hypothetical protein